MFGFSFSKLRAEVDSGLQVVQRHFEVGDFVVSRCGAIAGIDVDRQAGKQQLRSRKGVVAGLNIRDKHGLANGAG